MFWSSLFLMSNQTILERVPDNIATPVDAALEFIRAKRGDGFDITGIVDPLDAFEIEKTEPIELGLILCDGEICIREQVLLTKVGENWAVSEADQKDSLIPAHLDPPAGVRLDWLQRQIDDYSFVLLLYYRGLW
ncbi:MAG TPA: hypothetical protein DCR03_08325 [Gammaproteobacteria bacterium]|nr:hypothetical protein [Gammaproteobacteria bacterium]